MSTMFSLDNTIILVFLLLNLAIGICCRKKNNNLSQFAVSDRSFSSWVIFLTLSATFLGGGYTFGNASSVFSHGMVYAYALMGFSLKELLVALFIAPRMATYNDCLSIGDMIEKTYGTHAKIVCGVFSLIICGGILGAQVGALTLLLRSVTEINTTFAVGVSLAVLIFYAAIGGMKAVVYTDVLQACILFVGIPLTLVFGVAYLGGWHIFFKQVPAGAFSWFSQDQGHFYFWMLFLSFMFGETLVPPYAQRLFMAETTRITSKGTLASAFASVPLFFMAGLVGLVAYVIKPGLDPNNAFVYVVHTVMPIGLRGFVLAALLSIILSSASSFLNSASIAFTNDIVRPLVKSRRSLNFLKMAQISTIIVGVISIVFALSYKNVLSLLLASYNFWSPVILVPMLFAIFKWPCHRYSFWFGALCGALGSIIWGGVLHEPHQVPALLVGILCNALAFIILKFTLASEVEN